MRRSVRVLLETEERSLWNTLCCLCHARAVRKFLRSERPKSSGLALINFASFFALNVGNKLLVYAYQELVQGLGSGVWQIQPYSSRLRAETSPRCGKLPLSLVVKDPFLSIPSRSCHFSTESSKASSNSPFTSSGRHNSGRVRRRAGSLLPWLPPSSAPNTSPRPPPPAMSLKQELQTWSSALAAYDQQEWDLCIELFDVAPSLSPLHAVLTPQRRESPIRPRSCSTSASSRLRRARTTSPCRALRRR